VWRQATAFSCKSVRCREVRARPLASSMIMDVDNESGEFVILAPMVLPEGDHNVKVQGIDLAKNIYTSAVGVDFMVAGGIVKIVEADTNDRMKVIGVGLGAVLMLVVFWLIAHARRPKVQN
jgi:hypothetical protein